MLVNSVHKQAAKAAIARMVVLDHCHPGLAGTAVASAASEMGLQLGDLGSAVALSQYAAGVAAKGEKACNRKWSRYPKHVRVLASKLRQHAAREINDLLC